MIAFGFSGIYKKRKKKKKKQQQTIRKLSESKEAESIRFEKCLKLLPFLVSASADISHTTGQSNSSSSDSTAHTHIVTHSSRSRSTLYILYNTIPAGGWSKKKEKKEKGKKRILSLVCVYTHGE